jgi:hypothetical protein
MCQSSDGQEVHPPYTNSAAAPANVLLHDRNKLLLTVQSIAAHLPNPCTHAHM